MKKTENESASLEAIITLLFLYTVGSLVTIFGYVMLSQGERGELNPTTLSISIFSICLVFAFSFVGGFLKRKAALYGLVAALALNATILPIAIYTAPVHALAIFISQKFGLHYIGGYVFYAAMQFVVFGLGYILSKIPSRLNIRVKGSSA